MRPSYDQLEASCRILADENERLQAVLAEILNEHHWVDAHPGEPCKRLLNAVRVSTWERWRAALYASSPAQIDGGQR